MCPVTIGAAKLVPTYSATLPFSPTAEQAHELDFSAGTGLSVSNGRAQLLFAVERAMRDGAGVSERSWQLSFGLHIRP